MQLREREKQKFAELLIEIGGAQRRLESSKRVLNKQQNYYFEHVMRRLSTKSMEVVTLAELRLFLQTQSIEASRSELKLIFDLHGVLNPQKIRPEE